MGKVLFMRKGDTHTVPFKPLPAGYARLAYIQSSGTQYVDTGFIPTASPRAELDMTVLDDNDLDAFGTPTATAPCWILNFDTDYEGSIFYRYGSSSYGRYTYASDTLVNRRAKYSVGQTIEIDGITCLTRSSYDFSGCTQTVRLFGARTFMPMRLYSCQLYNNNELVRDFVPCINASGAVGLYDLVGKKFYGNAGTGAFVGSEVA